MKKKITTGKRTSLHAKEVFQDEEIDESEDLSFEEIADLAWDECDDNTADTLEKGLNDEVYVSLDSPALLLPKIKISHAEAERESAITRVIISLRLVDHECTEEDAGKVLDVLRKDGSDLNDENIIAAFKKLNVA